MKDRTQISRRAFSTHLAAMAAGMGLAAVPPGTPPAPPMADASEGFGDASWFPMVPDADAAMDEGWERLDTLLHRLRGRLDLEVLHDLEAVMSDLTIRASEAAAAHLHEHILETYRKGGRITIVVQSLGSAS